MNKIRVHITIPVELDQQIREYGKENNLIYSHTVRELIERGLNNILINKELEVQNTLINKIFSKQVYIRDLLEQFYTDMEIEKNLNPNSNKALQNFKKNIYKDKFND